MRIKPLIYSAAAVLLGFAIMMVPLALQTGPPTYQPQLSPFPHTRTENTFSGALSSEDTEKSPSFCGFDQLSKCVLPFTLILLIGLVVAIGVYATFRKRLA